MKTPLDAGFFNGLISQIKLAWNVRDSIIRQQEVFAYGLIALQICQTNSIYPFLC